MTYYDAKEIYDEFVKETVKLQFEIGNLDNEVEKPFEKLYELLYGDVHDFNTLSSFYEYRDKVALEFVKVVQSRGLSVHDKYLHWWVLPFGDDYLPYMYDRELGSLLDVLTEGELNFEFGDYYSVYDFEEYWMETNRTLEEVINVFLERLSKINYIRNNELPKINKLCEELREDFSTNALFEDCKNFISR